MWFTLKNQDSLMRAGLFPHALSSRDNNTMTMRFCTVSVTSSMDNMAPGLSQQSKGNFLFSSATAASHVNNSTQDLEDGVVNSPPSHVLKGSGVCFLLPLRCQSDSKAPGNGSPEPGRTNRQLYSTTVTAYGTNVGEGADVEDGYCGCRTLNSSEKHDTTNEGFPRNLQAIEVKEFGFSGVCGIF